MSVTNEIISLAEDEKLIREYHVGRVRFPAKMDAYLTVTNKRVALLAKGGILRKSYSTNEVHIDDASGVNITTTPKNWIGIIIGVVVLIVGLISLLTSQRNITYGIDIFSTIFSLILIIAGIIIIAYYSNDRFMFIIITKATTPAFAIASPNMFRRGIQNGFSIFIGRPGDQTFQVAREIGAIILDVKEKGNTKIGEQQK